jgi:Holliday junction DNA helicase RuvA
VISSLRGTIEAQLPGIVVIDVSGVGYGVHVTPQHAAGLSVGESAHLVITTIVREDAITLYGFESRESGQIFDTLLSVTGVGPRSALAVLSHLTPAQVFDAVANDDDKAFTRVSGIGPKTAKLICVQLAGRLDAVTVGESRTSTGERGAPGDAVVAALVGLGWNDRLARETVNGLETEGKTTSQLLRDALALMARQP